MDEREARLRAKPYRLGGDVKNLDDLADLLEGAERVFRNRSRAGFEPEFEQALQWAQSTLTDVLEVGKALAEVAEHAKCHLMVGKHQDAVYDELDAALAAYHATTAPLMGERSEEVGRG